MINVFIKEYDYADEFDYPVVFAFKGDKQELIKLIKECEQYVDFTQENEFYFGTNEALDFSVDDILSMIDNAKLITAEELEVLNKFKVLSLGINMLDRVRSHIIDAICEDDPEELLIDFIDNFNERFNKIVF